MADETENTATPATGEEAGAEGNGDGGKAKKKKMLLIISSAIAVVGILVAVGVVFFMGGEGAHEAPPTEGASSAQLVIFDVPEFNLSLLSDDPAVPHFIKMKTAVELARQSDVETVRQALPRLQDDWGGLLRQMRVGDLQGSANLHRLKENLLRRALQTLAPVEVKAVYIRELLVQ